MNTLHSNVLLAALCLGLLAAPARAELDDTTRDHLSGLASYRFGENRASLSQLEHAVATETDPEKRAALAAGISAVISAEGTTLEGRRNALRLFALVGTVDSLPNLLPLLSDPALADTALWAVESIPGDAVDNTLIAAVNQLAPERQVAVVQTLGRRGATGATGVVHALVASENAALADAALTALGMIGGPEALGLLLTLRSQGVPEPLRPALFDACLRAARSMESADAGLATGLYAELAGGGQPGHVRAGAVSGLIRLQPGRALDHIRMAFQSTEPALRNLALSHVRTYAEPALTATFTGLLPSLPPADRVLLMRALADRGDTAAAGAVLAQAADEDGDVRLAAMAALGRIGNEDALPALLEQAATGRRDAKAIARESLATLPGAGVDEALVEVAKSGAAEGRVEALRALGARRALSAAADVRSLAEDGDEEVRGAALQALRSIGGEADLKHLVGRVAQAPASAQDRLAQTIVAIAQRTGAPGKRAAEPLRAYKAAKDSASRVVLIGILGRIGSEDALEALRGAAKDTDAALRLAAVQALAAWPDAAPLEDLLALAKTPADAADRDAAFRGYTRLLREAGHLSPAERVARYEEAMALAQNTDERRAVLAGLPTAPAQATLELAAQFRNDGELAAEALQAELQLCAALAGAYPEAITARLDSVLQGNPGDAARAQADAIRNAIARFDGYLTAWVYAGPYFEEAKTAPTLFEMAFPPEQDPAGVTWNVLPMTSNPENPWILSLAEALGGFERVAYLRTTVHADADQEAVLELGTNDGCKVWWNGALIHGVNLGRPLTPGEDKLPVSLKAGANDLMIAVFQHGGDWAAAARLVDQAGNPLTAVRGGLPE